MNMIEFVAYAFAGGCIGWSVGSLLTWARGR